MNTKNEGFQQTVGGEQYDYFSLAVPWHDEFQRSVAGWVRRLLKQNQPLLLEMGCGTGITTKHLVTEIPTANTIAVDDAPTMLDQARVQCINDPRIRFVQADVIAYMQKQPAQSFDGVVSAFMLHNLLPSEREQVMREVGRIVKPGGVFVNGDKIARNDQRAHLSDLQEQLAAFAVYDAVDITLRPYWVKHYLDDEAIRFTAAEQAAYLRRYEFIDIRQVFRHRMEAIFVAVKA